MGTIKKVQIILIILCALTILAGCAYAPPQDVIAQTAAQTQISESEQTPTAAPTPTPTQAPTIAPSEAPTATAATPTQASTATPTQAPTIVPTEAPTPQTAIVTISIDCANATEGGVPGAPESGWIMGKKEIELQDGDTVWDVLNRICRDRGIAVSKTGSGSYIFVKSIAGVAPVSAQSGWMFSVNGVYVQTGAGNYVVSGGDAIRWKYTMNGGDDL